VTVSPDVLRRLAAIDTPTVCNVIELFAVRPQNQGFTDERICAAFPEMPPMVGFASTVAFRSDAPSDGSSGYSSFDRHVEHLASLPGPSVVVVQDLDDPPVAASLARCSVPRTGPSARPGS
jgi:4-hydroxy-4-methyl-2-oxoglutarate aldolase